MRDFAKLDILLRAAFILALIALFGIVVRYVAYSFESPVPAAFSNKDFANYWIAGQLVLEGQSADLFGSHPLYFRHLTEAFGADYPWHSWSYPPHYLLLVWWTGYFGYGVGLAVFMAVTGALFIYATKAFVGRMDLCVVAMVLPFAVCNLWAGQNGFLTAALALGALALRADRPVIAGVLLGLLTIKPQLGFLFPLLLFAERRWMVIVSAGLTTLALIALSVLFYGVEAWNGYLATVLPYQSEIMQKLEGSFLLMLTSFYGGLRNWGYDYSEAIVIHAALAIPALLATIYGFFAVKDPDHRSLLLLLGTFVITPYALIYDLGMIAAAAAMITIKRSHAAPPKDPLRYLMTIAAVLPLCAMSLSRAGVPAAPLILSLLYGYVFVASGALTRLKKQSGRTGMEVRPSPAAMSD